MLDIVIKNGYVIDGSGNPWTKVDVGIKNGKIVELKKFISESADRTIDATDKVVSPGFIDTHVHSDLLCTQPETHQIKLKQGITTELLGQDGISVAPVTDKTEELWRSQLKGLNGDIGEWPWRSVRDYLNTLKEAPLLGNVSYLIPHGNIRTMVMGFDDREAHEDEMIEMRQLVEKAMEEGGVGFSSGLVYPPNVFSTTKELIEICKGVTKYDGCFVVHMRNESFNIMEAFEEMITVAKESGVRLHISHLKVIGTRNRHLYPILLDRMNAAREEGVEITFDQYPYTAASTVFHAILPPWVHDGGTVKMLERLQEPKQREVIKKEFQDNLTFENWVYNCGWENIVISSVGTAANKPNEGLSILEISTKLNKEPADTAFDLLIEEKGNIQMVIHWGMEEDIVKAMKSPYHIVGSDSIFGSKPHPRLSGTHPRVLGRYVREQNILSLEEAIHHMTGAPAQLLRYKDRGLLKEGYWADVVVFDPNTVQDGATFDSPLEAPEGIEKVIVNGKIVMDDGELLFKGNGKVLSRNLISESSLRTQ
ncbi:N-acyl-D-amino-acid deacylase [Bacillus pakistanensis]|uniref:N-acyl-D-amino-acid deacylase n=1 Tax=Rossellomorea pakistanensis TaxID=992288 RepID=A0ABS2NHG4_9BACI|nr:D-aminoacylase [Bacillus pakistanensis]MBM7587304.1 N-acyl-D-amino-acid deacylase [Bacillus pakistanensis]